MSQQPRYHAIPDIMNWPNGTALEGLQGRLVKLFQRKEGSNSNGAWSLQGGELKDEHGNSIEVTFKDQDVIPDSWKNQWLILTATYNDKNKLCGLTVDDWHNQNKNTTTRRIKISTMARIEFGQGGGAPPQQQQGGGGWGGGQQRQQPQQQRPQQGPGQQSPRQQSQPQQRPQEPQQTGPKPIHGQTVGMAVKEAVGIIGKFNKPEGYYHGTEFPREVWAIASQLIRVSGYLEKGKLAPNPADTQTAPAQRQAPPPRQEPAPRQEPPPIDRQHGQDQQHEEQTDSYMDGMQDDEIPF